VIKPLLQPGKFANFYHMFSAYKYRYK